MVMSPSENVSYLDAKLLKCQRHLRKLDAYYEGEQPLKFLALELKEEFGERLTEMVINWPEMVADAYEQRLDLTGFRMPESTSNGVDVDDMDASLWRIWQDNDMDRQAQQAHLESLVLGRSYAIVGARGALEEGPATEREADPFDEDTDSPLITVEHPTQCITETDPRTRKPSSALKRWKDPDGVQRATLYRPEATYHFVRTRQWRQQDVDDHGLGVVPVVPLVNRSRMLKHDGRSEFRSIIPVADAANKIATDMMVSAEFHAMPRRWALGMTNEDFEDEDGNPISPFEQIAGRIWAHRKKPDEVKVGQFPEADLANFHNTLKLLAELAGQLGGLPPHYGFSKENPTSADAIRSSEARLVKRVERKQTGWGSDWRRVVAIAVRIRDGEQWNRNVLRAKTVWRDASTPTVAQAADATVKKRQDGIITLRQARIDLQYSPEEIRRMEQEDAEEREADPIREIARNLPGPEPGPDPAPDDPGVG